MFGSFGPPGGSLSHQRESSSFNPNANRSPLAAPRTPTRPGGSARPMPWGFNASMGAVRPDRGMRTNGMAGGSGNEWDPGTSGVWAGWGSQYRGGVPVGNMQATQVSVPPLQPLAGPVPPPSAMGFDITSLGLPPATAFAPGRRSGGPTARAKDPSQRGRLTGTQMAPPPRVGASRSPRDPRTPRAPRVIGS